jgi:hypothetical protein
MADPTLDQRHFIVVEIAGEDVQAPELEFIAGVIETEVKLYHKTVKAHTGIDGVIKSMIHQIL